MLPIGSQTARLEAGKSETKESWFNRGLTICQPMSGYRYTIDPFILCSQVSPPENAHILDIGCGCGIIPLILGYRHSGITLTGVEIQEELAKIAIKNAADNRMHDRIRILCQDITTLTMGDIGKPADLIVSNPPYKKRGTGRTNPNPGRAIARHEIMLTIDQIFDAAANLLAPAGQLCIIFPADRLKDLESAADRSGMALEWICFVHLSRKKTPFRVLVSAVKNPVESQRVLPPLILYNRDNSFSKAHKALFNP